jgi:hypothetical protein
MWQDHQPFCQQEDTMAMAYTVRRLFVQKHSVPLHHAVSKYCINSKSRLTEFILQLQNLEKGQMAR